MVREVFDERVLAWDLVLGFMVGWLVGWLVGSCSCSLRPPRLTLDADHVHRPLQLGHEQDVVDSVAYLCRVLIYVYP